MGKRSYGTGSLLVRVDRRGGETWYGQWRVQGKLLKKRIGSKRVPGAAGGLSKAAADKELRRPIDVVSQAGLTEALIRGSVSGERKGCRPCGPSLWAV